MRTKHVLIALALILVTGAILFQAAIERHEPNETLGTRDGAFSETESSHSPKLLIGPIAIGGARSVSEIKSSAASSSPQAGTLRSPPANPEVVEQPILATDEIAYLFARAALASVGVDEEAEEYWIDAINDPEFTADERRALIEGLSEEGIPDPENPSADDFLIIVRRLLLIEALDPMDEANAEAFGVAYMELWEMYETLMEE
jgi:hypothetical protein